MLADDQIPFSLTEFAENPEPRCPCVLLLDTSTSMRGKPIQELNDALRAFQADLRADGLAMQRVELGIVTFGPVRVEEEFRHAEMFSPPVLEANGDTPLGAAIVTGLDMLEARKRAYKQAGIAYFRPWVFLITDGASTDDWRVAADRVRAGDNEQSKAFSFFAVAVQGADMNALANICSRDRPPLPLRGLAFRELFKWLSSSLAGVARSQPGQLVALQPPIGWAAVG